jgi:hypothetical protein
MYPRDAITKDWRILYNEELNNLFNIVKIIKTRRNIHPRDAITKEWRTLYNEELNNLFNIVKIIKTRRNV